jgi:soluble lytic murein transglycosylase-like protein
MQRIIVVPAVLIGCLIVIWVGTVAAAQMPPQALLAPTLTAAAEASAESDRPGQGYEGVPETHNTAGCSLPASYPEKVRRWCEAIERYAQETGLPANLIAAVMLQESGGNPEAYSHSGAVGLMQIMPRDGIAANFMCINGPCFASRPTIEELKDPDFNIAYGTRMLANLSTKHGSTARGCSVTAQWTWVIVMPTWF